MSDATARLNLPYLAAAQAQKHVTHNEALALLDVLVQSVVVSRSLAQQPADPGEGEVYILPAGAGGADWSGRPEGVVMAYRDGVWRRIDPRTGWRVHVADEAALIVFDGADWVAAGAHMGPLSNLPSLGVGTAPDAANPLAVKLNNALFAAQPAEEGGTGDLRLVFNKQSAPDVLSLLFQSGWSGRAELGLVGDDALSVKMSPDGVNWNEALRVEADGCGVWPAGVEIAALNQGPLGGLRNHLINGDFRFWSRGTGLSSGYVADRWKRRAAGGLAHVFDRGDFAPGQGDVPGEPEFYLRWTSTGGAATSGPVLAQPIEGVRTLAGRRVSLSFWARAAAPLTMRAELVQAFGGGGSSSQVSVFTDFAITSGWARYEASLALPDLSGKTIGSGGEDVLDLRFEIQLPVSDPAIDLARVQLEEGPRATPFEQRPVGLEASLCARYFRRIEALVPETPGQLGLLDMRATPSVSGGGAGADFSGTGATALVGRQDFAAVQTLELDAEL